MSRRLVVLHQGAIGDFVLALGVVQAARAHLGGTEVLTVASAPSAPLAAGRSAVDAWLAPEAVGLHSLFRDDGQLDVRLVELLGGASCVLSFLGSRHEPLHERLAGAAGGLVVSIDPRPAAATLESRRHITQQWVESARQQGLAIAAAAVPMIRWLIDRPERTVRRAFTATNPSSRHTPDAPVLNSHAARRHGDSTLNASRVFVVHPGSGGREKCWPVERFVGLAGLLDSARVTWLLGPAEVETDRFDTRLIHERAARFGDRIITGCDMEEAAALIADADVYIGNDAGMTHVAAGLGVPTVAIFGPTDPRVWRPLGSQVSIAGPPLPGPIEQVGVQDVLGALASLSLPNGG